MGFLLGLKGLPIAFAAGVLLGISFGFKGCSSTKSIDKGMKIGSKVCNQELKVAKELLRKGGVDKVHKENNKLRKEKNKCLIQVGNVKGKKVLSETKKLDRQLGLCKSKLDKCHNKKDKKIPRERRKRGGRR